MVKKNNKKGLKSITNKAKILQPIDSYTKDYYKILKEKSKRDKNES
jgi:hypothetical protein